MKGNQLRSSTLPSPSAKRNGVIGDDAISGSTLAVLPTLLTGSGRLGFDTFARLADVVSDFVPSANRSACTNVRWKKKALCNAACVSLCPTRAISVTDSVSIDSSRCISCNVCATACPYGVFDPKLPSDSTLHDSVLTARRKGKNAVRFSCDRCSGRYGRPRRRTVKGAETVVLPCLGSLSETLPLYALHLGLDVVIDTCVGDCEFPEGRECCELAMKRFESVREGFVVRPHGTFGAADNERATGLERRAFLLVAGEKILKVLFAVEEPGGISPPSGIYRHSLPLRRKMLLVLTQGLEPRPRNATALGYPILDVKIDGALCNLCQVCTKMCPTGALRSAGQGDVSSISFALGKCTGCRLCIETCPKSCISSSDADLADINSSERILVEKMMYICKGCNSRFARDSLAVTAWSCPICRKRKNPVLS